MADGICQECHEFGLIHVHHKDGNHDNDAQGNRRTLCPSCHRLEHVKDKEPTPYCNASKKERLPREIVERQYSACFPRV